MTIQFQLRLKLTTSQVGMPECALWTPPLPPPGQGMLPFVHPSRFSVGHFQGDGSDGGGFGGGSNFPLCQWRVRAPPPPPPIPLFSGVRARFCGRAAAAVLHQLAVPRLPTRAGRESPKRSGRSWFVASRVSAAEGIFPRAVLWWVGVGPSHILAGRSNPLPLHPAFSYSLAAG